MAVDETGAGEIVQGVADIVATPVGEATLLPAAREVGKSLETVAKAVNVALSPLRLTVWGYERIVGFLEQRLAEKLRDVPPEAIKTPPLYVAGPVLEALRFTADQDDLREMYASLLANAMDSRRAMGAHPGFVEILKQFTPDEARIVKRLSVEPHHAVILIQATYPSTGQTVFLRSFSKIAEEAGCTFPDMASEYLGNLNRLGITAIEPCTCGVPHIHDALRRHPAFHSAESEYDSTLTPKQRKVREIVRVEQHLRLTIFGRKFVSACIDEAEESGTESRGTVPDDSSPAPS